MNNSSDKKGRKIASYIIPGIITLLVMVFVLIVKGIWPFGSNRIDLFDNMQQVAPLYAHLWDAMHGNASVWFDWYTGLGTNVSMSISAFSMFSPFNLLLYLCPRDYILEFISILTLVKMFVMSVTMYAFLNRRYKKLTYKTKVIFALAYTFCGYVLLYASCFTPWMDIVALFPLLMMSLDVMEKTGKKFFYILMLALLFVINYYISAMSVVYILLAGGMYIIFRCDKEERRKCAWNLGIGTFTGIGLSAFVLLPVFSQLSQSQRTGNSLSLVQQYMSWISNPTFRSFSLGEFERIMMFYGMGIFLVLIFTGIHRSRKLPRYKMDIDLRKRNWYAVSLFAIMVIQAVAEASNITSNRDELTFDTDSEYVMLWDSKGKACSNVLKEASYSDYTVYARWKPKDKVIKYISNTSSVVSNMPQDINTVYGSEVSLSGQSPSRKLFKFDGWNTEADGSGDMYYPLEAVTELTKLSEDTVNLYAQWQQQRFMYIKASSTTYCDTLIKRTPDDELWYTGIGSNTIRSLPDSMNSWQVQKWYIDKNGSIYKDNYINV